MSPGCPECWPCFLVDVNEGRPAGELAQLAFGCDATELRRFFHPTEWLDGFTMHMIILIGTPAEWEYIAALWRWSRQRRDVREIDLAWEE